MRLVKQDQPWLSWTHTGCARSTDSPTHAVWSHSRWSAPWSCLIPKSGWKACSSPDPFSNPSDRWVSYWQVSSHLGLLSWPGLLKNDRKQLGNHVLQLPQYPQLDIIWPFHSPGGVAAAGYCFLLNCGGYILLPISIFQIRALSTLRVTGLTMKDRRKKINSIPTEARTNLLWANGILCHLPPVQEEYSFPVSVLRVLHIRANLVSRT